MSLILKQEPANTIATPPAGKSTLFVDDNSVMSVKNPAGVVTTFPTVQGANTQVFFNDEGAINGSANLSFVKTTNTLTVNNGNVVATGVKTDNLYYANGSPWDLQQPAGSNDQIQYNDNGSFGASANLTFNGTSLNTTANLNVTGNAYISGNLTVDGNVVYVNVESLSVEDPLISLGGGPNGNALTSNNGFDRGLILHNYTTQTVDAFMGWDTSNSEFAFASNASVANNVVTINTLGNVRANNIAGTLSTAAQPNITSVGTLTGLLVGATAAQVDFPNAKAIMSQDNSGQTHSENIGVVGEAVANSGNANIWGIGVLGEARANGATKATGVQGGGYVTNSTDTGAAVGVRGYSIQTHSGGYNIGVLGNAAGSGLGNYAFYVQAGNIGSIETTTNWELIDDEAAALTFSSTGKANIFGIETTDGAEGIYTQGYLNVTGNANVGGLLTNNLYYANGSPWDLQQAGGSNTQIQFNDADNFGGSAAFTFNKTSNTVQLGGVLSVVGNANIGNIGTGGLVTATGNIGGGNINTGGVVTATGNVTGGNLITGGLVTATGNVTAGNLVTGGVVSATGNANVGNLGTTGVFATTLSATGNANVGNIGTGGLITATGNLNAGNIITGGIVSATGNITAGNLTTTGTANVGNLKVTGNVTGPLLPDANVTYDLGSDTQRWKDLYLANTTIYLGNANIKANGTSITMSGNTTAANLITAGVLSVGGNANIGNIGTGGLITATGNLNAGNIITAGVVSATGNGTFGNVSATTFTGALSGAATTAGTVTTAAQPNITSVGTLTSVSVSGNANIGNIGTGGLITATGNINGGNIITGGVVSATGNANVGNLGTTGVFATTLSTTGNANVGNLGTTGVFATTLSATGNANVGNIGAAAGVFTTVAGSLTTASQPNVTSVGTLTSVSVSGNANVGNLGTAGLITATGNINGANINGTFYGAATGLTGIPGANVTGQVGNALVAGTVYTAAQPNITSVGTLTSVSVSGNANIGNIGTSGLITATGNLNAGNIITGGVVSATGTITGGNLSTGGTLSATGNATVGNISATNHTGTTVSVTGNVTGGNLVTGGLLSVTGTGSFGGNVAMNSFYVTGLSDPVNNQDAATKKYVDDIAQGLNIHDSCNAATTGTLATISGGTVTYNNGTAGVGATLTTTGSYTTMDGVTLSNGMRILVKNETTAANNGIYVRTSATVLTRATDYNTVPEIEAGDFTFVTAGTLYDNTGWVQTSSVTTIGTDPIDFTQFSGAGTYTAGTGLTLTGSTFSVNASQTQITSVGTLTTLSVSGNANVGNIGATTFVGALSGAATTAGTVTTAAQPNITSVGTLTSLGVNGTVTAVAFTANTGVFTGNGSGLSAIAGGNVTGTVSSATTAGTVTTAAQPNITSVGTLTSLGVSGAVTAGTLVSNVATGTAPLTVTSTTLVPNLSVARANVADLSTISTVTTGNVYISFVSGLTGNLAESANSVYIANIANGSLAATTFVGALSGAATSATTAGTVTTAAQPNITSVGTLTSLGVNGTVTAVAFTANTGVFTGNGSGLSAIAGGNVTGTVSSATTAGTVTTAAQPNITSVGTLTSLTVSGNVGAGNVNATSAVVASTLTSNVATGTAPLTVTSTTRVNNLNVAYANVADFINIADVTTGTYYPVLANATTGNVSEGSNSALSFAAATGTLSATVFSGSGASLTSLNGSNISSGTIAQARLANSSITVNGTSISLGGSGTITATATGTLTIGTGLGGTSYNGSTGVTITNTGVTSLAGGTNISVSGGTGAVTVSVSGQVANALVAGTVYTAAQPNITSVSTSFTSLTFANAQTLTGNNFTLSTGANTNAGTITGTWTLSAGSKLNATYADLAEKYTADADYEPGTVVLFGGEQEVTLSTETDSFRVAGVVTTNPAYVMNNGCEGEHVITLALQGRVPVKVLGPVSKGDLLVSSTNGHATANNIARAGTIIGKSLENFTGASGIVEVAVGRF